VTSFFKKVITRHDKQVLRESAGTKDTVRGLIVNMSDVLFDTGQYSLRPGRQREAGQDI